MGSLLRSLCHRATVLWGWRFQVDITIEECNELALALSHLKRGRPGAEDKAAEECADVEIVCEQIRSMIGNEAVDKWRGIKIARLEQRILEAESSLSQAAEDS